MSTDENGGAKEINTLYCSGFPIDVTYREVHNMFQFMKGFKHARLVESKVPLCFVTFASQEDALAVKELMHGSKLDEDSNIEFRLELAKSSRNFDAPPRKRFTPRTGAPGGMGMDMGDPRMGPSYGGKRDRPENAKSTIMISGLGPDSTESSVSALVTPLGGFMHMRWSPSKRSGGSPVAFADFSSRADADQAVAELRGQIVQGSRGLEAKVDVPKRTRNAPPRMEPGYAPMGGGYGGGYAGYGYGAPPGVVNDYGVGPYTGVADNQYGGDRQGGGGYSGYGGY